MRHGQRISHGRFIALLVAAALVAGCGRGFIPEPTYQPTAIPEDIAELFELSGNAASDTVWIFEQGGPLHFLDPNTSDYFHNYSDY